MYAYDDNGGCGALCSAVQVSDFVVKELVRTRPKAKKLQVKSLACCKALAGKLHAVCTAPNSAPLISCDYHTVRTVHNVQITQRTGHLATGCALAAYFAGEQHLQRA